LLQTGTADKWKRFAYTTMMQGNEDLSAYLNRITSNKHFIPNILIEYLKEIDSNMPNELAFDLRDSELLVWAEIDNDGDKTERLLLLSEAKVNAKYHQFGYDIVSTIIEKRDKLTIPSHYTILYKKD
jgi:hypothetical protein